MADTSSLIVGIDLGTTNSLVGAMDAGFPILLADADGQRLTPSVVYFPPPDGRRRAPRGPGGRGAARVAAGAHRVFGQAVDGHPRGRDRHDGPALRRGRHRRWRGAGADRRARAFPGGDLGAGAGQAQGGRRARAGRAGRAGRGDGPGVLQRRPAPGHQGCRAAGGLAGRAHPQRADRRRARLRAGPAGRPREDRRLRPGRRHVRHLHPRTGRGVVPGALDQRQHAPGRGRHRHGVFQLPGRSAVAFLP